MNDKIYSSTIKTYGNSNLSLMDSLDKFKMIGIPIVGNNIKIKGAKQNLDSDTNARTESHTSLSSSNDRNVKLATIDRKKRKKFKEPGVVNVYLASAIPNNIGDKPVEELADYVNGSTIKDSSKMIKYERKLKAVKKQEKDKNDDSINEEKNNNSAVSGSVELKEVNGECAAKEINIDNNSIIVKHDEINCNDNINFPGKLDHTDKITNDQEDLVDGSSADKDDEFYQVVRHKTRNKTKILKPQTMTVEFNGRSRNNEKMSCKIATTKSTSPTRSKAPGQHDARIQAEMINVNDKQNLNWFIYHLWIEFQRKHDKYLKEQNAEMMKVLAN